jgi:hypothetical protein
MKLGCAVAVVVLAACGRSNSHDLARAENLRSELASAGLSSGSQGIVSDIEVPPLTTTTATPQGAQPDAEAHALHAPAATGTRAVANVDKAQSESRASLSDANSNTASNSPRTGHVQVTAPMVDVALTATAVVSPLPTPVLLPSPHPHAATAPSRGEGVSNTPESAGTQDSSEAPGAYVPRPRPEEPARPRPVPTTDVIIRGGSTGRDPCAIHIGTTRPGSIMINNRIPGGSPPWSRGGIR